jgi:hypothetical protein
MFGILMEFIVAQFVLNPDGDKKAASHTNCQSGDIDKGMAFMPFDVSQSDSQVVFKHG